MASANVYKSSAKYILGTKTLTLPSQQRPDSGGVGQGKNKVLASQSI